MAAPRLQTLLLSKSDDLRVQFFRYLFVGGGAAALDTATLYVSNRHLGVNHLLAAALGFTVGLLVNYLVSIAWVFESGGNAKQELFLFLLIGVGGLGLTEVIIWMAVDLAKLPLLGGKIIALVLVLLWNFGMRRKLVFSRSP